MRRVVKNFAMCRPIRTIAGMKEPDRIYLLKQMKNYVLNCEDEDRRLRSLKERVNR